MTDSIRHKFFGGEEFLSFADFAARVIQDDDEAARIARWLVANPDDIYPYNESDPEFYAEFSCLDAPVLAAQIEVLIEDWDDGTVTIESDEDGGCFEDEAMLAREEQRQHDRDLERDTLDRIPEAP